MALRSLGQLTGIGSLNGLSGPLTLTSTGGTISIVPNAGTHTIDLEVSGGGSFGLVPNEVVFGSASGGFGQSANLFWDNTHGYLGIGTATPSYPLDVNGAAHVAGGGLFVDSITANSNNFSVNSSGVFSFENGSIYSDGSGGVGIAGNLGVGQQTGAKFEVGGGGGSLPILINNTSGLNTAINFQKVGVTQWQVGSDLAQSGVNDFYIKDIAGNHVALYGKSGDLKLGGSNASTTPAVTILNGGNVGIRTTTPNFPLSFGNSLITDKMLALFETGGTGFYGFGLQAGATIVTANDVKVAYFSTNAGGSLGIHNSSPQTFLDVAGSIATGSVGVEDEFYLTRPVNAGVSFPQMAGFSLGRYTAPTSFSPNSRLDIKLKDDSTSTLVPNITVMTLQSNGIVGVGTTSPTMGAFQTAGGNSFTTIPANSSAMGQITSTSGWNGQGFLFSSNPNDAFSMVYAGGIAYFGQVTNVSQTPWYAVSGTGLAVGAAPLNKLDVGGAMAVGASYAGVSTAPTNGAIIQGKVGIGTTAPSRILQTQTSDGSGVGFLITGKATDGTVDNTNGAAIVLSSNSSGNRQIALADSLTGSGVRILGQTGVGSIDGFNYVTSARQDLQLGNDTTNVIALGTTFIIQHATQAALILNGSSFGQLLNSTGTLFISSGTVNDIVIRANAAAQTARFVGAGGFNVGASDQFQINSTGNIVKLNNVTTSFPSANAVGALTNDGSGNFSYAASGAGTPGLLATVAGINAKTIANTLLFTVPGGKTCVVTAYAVRCTAASAITVGPSASIGTTAGGNDIAASQTMTALTGTTNDFVWPIVGMSKVSTASVYFNLGTASTGTSQTIAVDLIGYYL